MEKICRIITEENALEDGYIFVLNRNLIINLETFKAISSY